MQLKILAIHSFLVHPGKNVDPQPSIGGTRVPMSGNLFAMLQRVFVHSPTECKYDIAFNHAADGTQQNDCRDLFIAYARKPGVVNGRRIAQRLQNYTTERSRLGLMFLIVGKQGKNFRLLVSRFPADNGILAEEDQATLNVEFLERIFMKNALAYKAALYETTSLVSGFWDGKAVDRQLNKSSAAISNYWIREFLDSDFRTPGAAATRRLAVAFRQAVNVADSETKEQLISVVRLLPGLDGQATSGQSIADSFSLPSPAAEALQREMGRVYSEQFTFSVEEFSNHVIYQSVELSNGGIMTAAANDFDGIFTRELLGSENEFRFTTEGSIVNQRLKKAKS